MALRTYGDKPISFQIEEGGEFYCVGSEVRGIHFVYNTKVKLLIHSERTVPLP